MVVYLQIQHGKDSPIGYEKNNVIWVNYSADMNKNFAALQNNLAGYRSGIFLVQIKFVSNRKPGRPKWMGMERK